LSSNGFQKENLSHATITHNNLLKLTIALIVFQDKFGKKLPQSKPKLERPAKILKANLSKCFSLKVVRGNAVQIFSNFPAKSLSF